MMHSSWPLKTLYTECLLAHIHTLMVGMTCMSLARTHTQTAGSSFEQLFPKPVYLEARPDPPQHDLLPPQNERHNFFFNLFYFYFYFYGIFVFYMCTYFTKYGCSSVGRAGHLPIRRSGVQSSTPAWHFLCVCTLIWIWPQSIHHFSRARGFLWAVTLLCLCFFTEGGAYPCFTQTHTGWLHPPANKPRGNNASDERTNSSASWATAGIKSNKIILNTKTLGQLAISCTVTVTLAVRRHCWWVDQSTRITFFTDYNWAWHLV